MSEGERGGGWGKRGGERRRQGDGGERGVVVGRYDDKVNISIGTCENERERGVEGGEREVGRDDDKVNISIGTCENEREGGVEGGEREVGRDDDSEMRERKVAGRSTATKVRKQHSTENRKTRTAGISLFFLL